MTDFAAAQKRILARRAARDTAAASRASAQQSDRSAALLRLPPSLRSVVAETLHAWDAVQGVQSPYGSRPAFRVGQVDAELLDEELLNLLKQQAGDGLKLFGAHLVDEWGAEINAGLRAILWKLSMWDHSASYGASLQGLKYVDARQNAAATSEATAWQRIAYGVLTVGGRYGWSRWEEKLSQLENGYQEASPLIQRLSRLTTFADSTHNVAAFVSFLVFLYNGRYRTLTDRLLRMRLVPSSNNTSREVSFEYLNRQLVWHAFTEFLLFLLPLVGISRWKKWLSRAWKKTRQYFNSLRSGRGLPGDEDDDESIINKGELAFLPEGTCAICYQDQNPTSGQSEQDVISASANSGIIGNASTDITNPYETLPCGCLYCFVCLAQRIEAEEGEGWTCLRCGDLVKECQPWDGDVMVQEPIRKSESKKNIAWADELVEEEVEEGESELMQSIDPMPVEEGEDDEMGEDEDEEAEGENEEDKLEYE